LAPWKRQKLFWCVIILILKRLFTLKILIGHVRVADYLLSASTSTYISQVRKRWWHLHELLGAGRLAEVLRCVIGGNLRRRYIIRFNRSIRRVLFDYDNVLWDYLLFSRCQIG
jgi:hypothetical protein